MKWCIGSVSETVAPFFLQDSNWVDSLSSGLAAAAGKLEVAEGLLSKIKVWV